MPIDETDIASRIAYLVEGIYNRMLGVVEEHHPYAPIINTAEDVYYALRKELGTKEAKLTAMTEAIRQLMNEHTV